MTRHQILVKPSSVARVLGTVAVLLVLASFGGKLAAYLSGDHRLYGLVWLFDVNREKNIPTGFAVFLLLLAALLLAVVAILERKRAGSSVLHWAVLACGFLFMAADEAWVLHERLIKPFRNQLGDDGFGILYFSWVVPYGMLVLASALFFWRFLLRLPAKTRHAFVVAAVLFVGGSIGVEMLAGRFAELHGRRNLAYSMFNTVEESLEMGGVIVFIWALLVFIADSYGEVRFRFQGPGGNIDRTGDVVK